MREVAALKVTTERFAPFGRVVALDQRNDDLVTETRTQAWLDRYSNGPLLSRVASLGRTESSMLGAPLERMERHERTEEAIIPTEQPVILTVTPATSNAEPDADNLAAFVIPVGTVVVMNPGVWHAECVGVHGPVTYLWMAATEDAGTSPWTEIPGGPVCVTALGSEVDSDDSADLELRDFAPVENPQTRGAAHTRVFGISESHRGVDPGQVGHLSEHGYAPAIFIGDIALDEYFAADRWPAPGDKAELETIATYVGGSIANAARVHAHLGGCTEFISLVNRGDLTPRLLRDLEHNRVGREFMLYDDQAVDQRNLIFLSQGEHVVFTPDADNLPMVLSEDAMAALSAPGYVYTTLQRAERLRLSTGGDAREVVRALRSAGRRFVFDLDVSGPQDGDTELLRGACLVTMNDRGFARTFAASNADSGVDIAGAAVARLVETWLAQHEIEGLLHTRSAQGARLYTRDGCYEVPGFTVDVVDVTGASDTLGGALVWALGAGYTLQEAVSFGVAAASRSVTRLGPQGGIASKREIEAFAREHRAS